MPFPFYCIDAGQREGKRSRCPGKLAGCSIIRLAVWALLIVIAAPGFDLPARILQARKPVRIQTLVAQATV